MAEKVKTTGVTKESGYLYYLDKGGNVARTKMARGANKGGGAGGGAAGLPGSGPTKSRTGANGGSGVVIIKEPEAKNAPGVWSMNEVFDFVKQSKWTN